MRIRNLFASFFAIFGLALTSCSNESIPVSQLSAVLVVASAPASAPKVTVEQLPRVEIVKQSTPQVALTEQFALPKGGTLWKYLIAQGVSTEKERVSMWHQACALTQKPCNDAWNKLPVGTVITVPRSDMAIAKDQAIAALARHAAVVASLRAEIAGVMKDLAILKSEIAELQKQNDNFLAVILPLGLFLYGGALYALFKIGVLKKENEKLADAEKDAQRDAKHHVIDSSEPQLPSAFSHDLPLAELPADIGNIVPGHDAGADSHCANGCHCSGQKPRADEK